MQETPPTPAPPAQVSPNRTLMVVLSYLWLLALIPLLIEKSDPEVQWHAKHGLVLVIGEIALWIVLTILTMIPGLGTVVGCALLPLIWLGVLVIHIIAIVKGVKGERLRLPFITDFADQWQ